MITTCNSSGKMVVAEHDTDRLREEDEGFPGKWEGSLREVGGVNR